MGMDGTARRRIALIGAGVVGTSLAKALGGCGHAIVGVASRTEEGARRAAERLGGAPAFRRAAQAVREADLVLLTPPDRSIDLVCGEIAAEGGFRPGTLVLHASGALDSGVLRPAREAGCEVASVHPLQTFASVEAALALFAGTYFFWEGSDGAGTTVESLVRELGGIPVAIATEGKALYHAAAVVACNYLVTLAREAVALMTAAGVPAELGLPALLPLIRGTVRNLEGVGLPAALTGPIARGDAATVARHLSALQARAPAVAALYRGLGRATVGLGREKGTLTAEAAAEIDRLLRAGD